MVVRISSRREYLRTSEELVATFFGRLLTEFQVLESSETVVQFVASLPIVVAGQLYKTRTWWNMSDE